MTTIDQSLFRLAYKRRPFFLCKNWKNRLQLISLSIGKRLKQWRSVAHRRQKVHDYFLLLLCKSSIWFTEKHIFKIIIYFFNTSKCATNYVISFDVFIGQKILKLWKQESWPFGPGWAPNITRIRSWIFRLPCDRRKRIISCYASCEIDRSESLHYIIHSLWEFSIPQKFWGNWKTRKATSKLLWFYCSKKHEGITFWTVAVGEGWKL